MQVASHMHYTHHESLLCPDHNLRATQTFVLDPLVSTNVPLIYMALLRLLALGLVLEPGEQQVDLPLQPIHLTLQ